MEDRKQEDIDMLLVLRGIKAGVAKLFGSLMWLFKFSIRNMITIGIFMIITISISLSIFLLKKPYYTSSISISHIRVENDYCQQLISSLNSNIENEDTLQLAKMLSISPGVAAQIKTIQYLPLNENVAKRFADSAYVMLPFIVEVEVYNNDILGSLQEGILSYLESNEYAVKRKVIDKQSLDRTETRVVREISEIDSLKRIVNQSIIPRSNGTGIILGEPIDPVSIYRKSMDSYEKLLLINKKQVLNNSFELMVGFTKSNTPSGYRKLWYLLTGALTGYLAGLVYLFGRRRPMTENG